MKCQFCNLVFIETDELQLHQAVECPAIKSGENFQEQNDAKVQFKWSIDRSVSSTTVYLLASDIHDQIKLKQLNGNKQHYISEVIPIHHGNYSGQLVVDGSPLPVEKFTVSKISSNVDLKIQVIGGESTTRITENLRNNTITPPSCDLQLNSDNGCIDHTNNEQNQKTAPPDLSSDATAKETSMNVHDEVVKRSPIHPAVVDECIVERETISTNYTLNMKRSLDKKVKACDRQSCQIETRSNGCTITLSTAAFEIFRSTVEMYLHNKQEYMVEPSNVIDEMKNIAQDILKAKMVQKQLIPKNLFTINLYRTTGRVMVNGPHFSMFLHTDLPLITKHIDRMEDVINLAHDQVKQNLLVNHHNHDNPYKKGISKSIKSRKTSASVVNRPLLEVANNTATPTMSCSKIKKTNYKPAKKKYGTRSSTSECNNAALPSPANDVGTSISIEASSPLPTSSTNTNFEQSASWVPVTTNDDNTNNTNKTATNTDIVVPDTNNTNKTVTNTDNVPDNKNNTNRTVINAPETDKTTTDTRQQLDETTEGTEAGIATESTTEGVTTEESVTDVTFNNDETITKREVENVGGDESSDISEVPEVIIEVVDTENVTLPSHDLLESEQENLGGARKSQRSGSKTAKAQQNLDARMEKDNKKASRSLTEPDETCPGCKNLVKADEQGVICESCQAYWHYLCAQTNEDEILKLGNREFLCKQHSTTDDDGADPTEDHQIQYYMDQINELNTRNDELKKKFNKEKIDLQGEIDWLKKSANHIRDTEAQNKNELKVVYARKDEELGSLKSRIIKILTECHKELGDKPTPNKDIGDDMEDVVKSLKKKISELDKDANKLSSSLETINKKCASQEAEKVKADYQAGLSEEKINEQALKINELQETCKTLENEIHSHEKINQDLMVNSNPANKSKQTRGSCVTCKEKTDETESLKLKLVNMESILSDKERDIKKINTKLYSAKKQVAREQALNDILTKFQYVPAEEEENNPADDTNPDITHEEQDVLNSAEKTRKSPSDVINNNNTKSNSNMKMNSKEFENKCHHELEAKGSCPQADECSYSHEITEGDRQQMNNTSQDFCEINSL